MKELVAYVARSLVDNKDAVTVEETVGPEATILETHWAHRGRLPCCAQSL